MRTKIWYGLIVFMAVLLVASVSECRPAEKSAVEESVPRVSCDELKSRLEEAPLVLIDVRQPKEWEESSMKIAGAL
jgi:3-mercaptopyruvate sulfurtransferase SseA